MRPRNDAEPGTGTQIVAKASPPTTDDDLPCVWADANGRAWKVGHDYLDTELRDVCELVEVIGRSSWCDSRDPEDCPGELVFEYDRYDRRVRVNPNGQDDTLHERFIERYTESPPVGAPPSPWPPRQTNQPTEGE